MSKLKNLEEYVVTMVDRIVDKKLRGKYLVGRKAVIVDTYDSTNNTATIKIPTDIGNPTIYSYPNKTNHALVTGQKAYLIYQLNNISQGWIDESKPSVVFNIDDYAKKSDLANYVKKTGDTMTGQLSMDDAPIVSDGTFNRGGWSSPTQGALTQIIDNSREQHSVIVGRRSDNGARLYGIDLLDDFDAPVMSLTLLDKYLDIRYGNIVANQNLTTVVSNVDSQGLSTNGTVSGHYFYADSNQGVRYPYNGAPKEMIYGNNGTTFIPQPLQVTGNINASGNILTASGGIMLASDFKFLPDSSYQALWTHNNYYGLITRVEQNYSSGKYYLELLKSDGDTWGIDMWHSDSRLKEHIRKTDVQFGMELIRKINHVQFDWLEKFPDGEDKHVQLGYVADELEKVYKPLIYEVGDKKIKHISHVALLPLVTKAMQELDYDIELLWNFDNQCVSEILSLKKQNAELVSTIKTLKSEIAEIKKLIIEGGNLK